jgi:NAD+ kinase
VLRFSNASARAVAVERALDAAGLAPDAFPGLCLVLGGDGTMLRAIARHGPAYAYLGVNCGHLGFLMNDLPGGPEAVAGTVTRLIAEGRYTTPAFPRLRMRAVGRDGTLHGGFALNDVYVERMQGQTCHLRVTVDGVEVVRQMVCDGIVIATALGSTAYSFSAGGPAAHPLLRTLHLTAICPHSPRLHPLLLPPTSTVRVEVLDAADRPARAVADGVAYEDVEMVEIVGGADEVRLCFAEGHDFTATMIRKVLQGGG